MAQSQPEIDEAFLNYALESKVVSALEAETLRTELRARRASQKDMTMQGLFVFKGVVTKEQGDLLMNRMNSGVTPKGPLGRATSIFQRAPSPTRPITPSPPAPTLMPDASLFTPPPPRTPEATLLPESTGLTPPPRTRAIDATSAGMTPPPPTRRGDATLVPDAGETHAGISAVDPDEIDEEEEVTSTAQAREQQGSKSDWGDGEPDTDEAHDEDETRKASPVETALPATPVGERKTAKLPPRATPEKPTARRTSNIQDSRPGRTTSKRVTSKAASSGVTIWTNEVSDELASAEKLVAPGTIIQSSQVTIAQVRQQMGIDEGVRLVSDKMGSTLAHLQPDASAEKKRYVVIREIARGGMGKVLEVEDTELRRSVALKVLRKELLGRRDVVERFLEEAQITGQLEHPNIVPVHEMGVDGAGNLYFTMKYVEGLSLSEVLLKLREGNRDTKRDYPMLKLLDVFIKICEGMAFAHNRGVIHRDLKPANIMVGKFGEVQVMDWGVGKIVGKEVKRSTDRIVITDRLEGGSANTMVGAVIGTPSYMAPEQARGDIDLMGPSTDIFSLGIILYEMLSLRSPWSGKSADEVLVQVREEMPPKPSERNPEAVIPAELERLCMKCLEKEQADRVETAKELADNVRSFIEGRTLGAVEYSIFRLAAKWINRHRKEVLGVTMMIVLLLGGIIGTLLYLNQRRIDEVKGYNKEGVEKILASDEQVNDGDFRGAELTLDEAKDAFSRVLAVDEADDTALKGVENVKLKLNDAREKRIKADEEKRFREKLERLNNQARDRLRAGLGEPNFLSAQEDFDKAVNLANAILAEDAGNASALETKSVAALEFAQRALKDRKFGLCEYMLKQLESTGLRKAECDKLKDELRRTRDN